jgi:hypothetical protein
MDGGCTFEDFWDDQLHTACSFVAPYLGGTYYCLPKADASSLAVTIDAFSDASCKVEAAYVKLPACDGAKPPPYMVVAEPACTLGWRSIRPVDPTPVTPPPLFTNSSGTCETYPLPAGATYYAAGAVMPNSAFVSATATP